MTELTSIEGRVVRPIGVDTFTDLTDAPLSQPDGVSGDGLLFVGDLPPDEVAAIWERMTSTDDTDQARRAALRALSPSCPCCASLIAYVLGDPLP